MNEKLFNLIVRFLEAENLIEKKNKKLTGGLLEDYSISEMHAVNFIGTIEFPNVTKLADKLNITKGGVSKIIKKLIEKKAVESYSLNTNKKEIYYKLTNKGCEIFKNHQKMHNSWCKKNMAFFEKCGEEEIKTVISFFEKYLDYLL